MTKLKIGDIVQTSQSDRKSSWIGLGIVRSFNSTGIEVEMLEGRNKGITGSFWSSQVTLVTLSKVKRDMLLHLYGE